MLVGTGEAPLATGEEPRPPRPSEIDGMLADLNAALPELRFRRDEIRRVFWGAIPADTPGRPSGHPVVVDHGCDGGPKGFHSVSGVKFTTARQVADRILGRIFPDLVPRPYDAAFAPSPLHGRRGLDPASDRIESWRVLAREESALSLADLMLRRSDLADRAPLSAETLSGLAGIFPEAESTQVETLRRILTEGLPRSDGAP
jgi:glycerol-3-phosphate dehydrogenase